MNEYKYLIKKVEEKRNQLLKKRKTNKKIISKYDTLLLELYTKYEKEIEKYK